MKEEWKTLELILYFPQLRNYRSWLRSCYYFLSFDCEKFDPPVFTIITSIKQKRKAVRVFSKLPLPSSRSSEQSNRVKPRVIIEPIYRYPFPIDRVRSLLINRFSRRLTGELDLGRRFCLPQWVSCFRRFVK